MAESTLEKGLKEKLTCPLCERLYRQPKTLPCFHSFCFDCLKELQRGTKLFQKLRCPVCNYGLYLEDRVALQALPSPYFISSLQNVLDCGQDEVELLCASCDRHTSATSFCFDCKCLVCQECIEVHDHMKPMRLHRILELRNIHSKDLRELVQGMRNCTQKSHENEQLVFFCNDCGECICEKCQTGIHELHRLNKLNDAKLQTDQEINSYIDKLDLKISSCKYVLQKTEADYNRAVGKIVAARTSVRDKINALVRVLRTHEKKMISELERIQLDLRQEIFLDKQDYEDKLLQMEKARDTVEGIIDRDIDIEMLNLRNSLIGRIDDLLNERIEEARHKSINIDYQHNNRTLGVLESTDFGQIKLSYTDPSCTEVIGDGLNKAVTGAGERMLFEVVTKDSEGTISYSEDDRLEVFVESEKGNTIQPRIEDLRDGRYKVSFIPLKPDLLTVYVTVMGQPIHDSPYQLHVKTRMEYLRQSLSSPSMQSGGSSAMTPLCILGLNRGHFGRPSGVAVNDDAVIAVADSRNQTVHILGLEGKVLRRLGEDGNSNTTLSNPIGVAFDYDSNVLVSDCDSHVVKVYNPSGECIQTFGKRNLERPLGVCCLADSSCFVCDSLSRSVKKFSPKGIYEGEFRSPDFHPSGKRVAPYFITRHKNKLFASFDNHSVQVFDEGGTFLYKIGEKGHGEGRFKDPRGLFVDSRDRLFVCDSGNHRVQVFSTDGRISMFGSYGAQLGQFDKPQDLAVTEDGTVVVTDFNNARIQVFRQETL